MYSAPAMQATASLYSQPKLTSPPEGGRRPWRPPQGKWSLAHHVSETGPGRPQAPPGSEPCCGDGKDSEEGQTDT